MQTKTEAGEKEVRGGTHVLDTRGTFCPIPILLTARKMREIALGDRIEMVGDDPGIEADMPAWCSDTGHRLHLVERSGREVRCIVEKRVEEDA